MIEEDYTIAIVTLKIYIRNFYASDLGLTNKALLELNNYFIEFNEKSTAYIVENFTTDP